MAEKDKVEKVLEDYEDVFADIYNTLVFGKKYLKEERIKDGATASIYKSRAGKHREQYRDVAKNYYENTLLLASFGIENQSEVEKFMPVRIMHYDAAAYHRQADKDKRLAPIMTIVLNFSEKRWTKPKSLHELMELPEELKSLVQDYHIQVFDIAYLEDEVIEQFQSDFKLVAKFFKWSRLNKGGLIMEGWKQPIEHVEAVMDLLAVFTGEELYREIYEEVLKGLEEKGERVTMCRVAEAYMNKGRMEGLATGRAEGLATGRAEKEVAILTLINNLMGSLSVTAEQAMDMLKVSKDEHGQYMV